MCVYMIIDINFRKTQELTTSMSLVWNLFFKSSKVSQSASKDDLVSPVPIFDVILLVRAIIHVSFILYIVTHADIIFVR